MAEFISFGALGQITKKKIGPGTYFLAYRLGGVVKRHPIDGEYDLWKIKRWWTNDANGAPEVFDTEAEARAWIQGGETSAETGAPKTTLTFTVHPDVQQALKPSVTLIGRPMAATVKTVTDKVKEAAKSKWWFWPTVVLGIAGASTGAWYGYKKLTK